MKDQSLKKNVILLIIASVLLAIALNINAVWNTLSHLLGLIMPLIISGIIAFILNVPMKRFENLFAKINSKSKKKLSGKYINLLSLWLSVICVVLVLILVCVLAIPEIISSLVGLYKQVEQMIPEISAFISKHINEDWTSYILNIEWLQEQLNSENISNLINSFSNGIFDIIGTVFTFASSAAGSLVSIGMSFIISCYILLNKQKIGLQSKKLLYAYCNKSIADKACYLGNLINQTYANFLSGQFVEAFVIAILIFITFTIAGLPYASLIAVLAGVLSFIPYIGSLFACIIGALLILLISPWKALLSIIVYQVVQFLEGQFIYPYVVGSSVGLPPVYTLLAALLGASLFGIIGIIFFIPLFSVVYTILKDCSNARLKKKGIEI